MIKLQRKQILIPKWMNDHVNFESNKTGYSQCEIFRSLFCRGMLAGGTYDNCDVEYEARKKVEDENG